MLLPFSTAVCFLRTFALVLPGAPLHKGVSKYSVHLISILSSVQIDVVYESSPVVCPPSAVAEILKHDVERERGEGGGKGAI